MRRWARGCYTLLRDTEALEQTSEGGVLDATLFLGVPEVTRYNLISIAHQIC